MPSFGRQKNRIFSHFYFALSLSICHSFLRKVWACVLATSTTRVGPDWISKRWEMDTVALFEQWKEIWRTKSENVVAGKAQSFANHMFDVIFLHSRADHPVSAIYTLLMVLLVFCFAEMTKRNHSREKQRVSLWVFRHKVERENENVSLTGWNCCANDEDLGSLPAQSNSFFFLLCNCPSSLWTAKKRMLRLQTSTKLAASLAVTSGEIIRSRIYIDDVAMLCDENLITDLRTCS